MITAGIENWGDVVPDLQPLIPLHWEELALDKDTVPLDPMWEVYAARDARGELLFIGLRDAGQLVGYFIGFIAPGLHYRTCLTCTMDIFYVHPEHRGRRAGILLFETVETELKRRGVQRWFVGSKLHKDASALFERLGFAPVETYYSKLLRD